MAAWEHGGGFSVDASVRIAAADRAGRERLLRYCARPPFALDRLRELDPEHLLYERTKPGPGGTGSLLLTPPQLLDRLAALMRDRAGRSRGPACGDATPERDAAPRSRSRAAPPRPDPPGAPRAALRGAPPRAHRHRYYGVLAPDAPLRAAVTALAPVAVPTPPAPPPDPPTAEPAPARAARYAWALLLARIYEVFPLVCPLCGAEMRIIAFITDASVIRDILVHLGEPIAPPRVAPARGPPLWDLPAAGEGGGAPVAQPAPAYAFDQRVAW